MGMVSQRLRDSARGQQCSLQFPGVCNRDPATTVLAHLPSPVKGMGNKGDDFFAVFACSNCHERLDLHNVDQECVVRALQRTMKFWIENGYLMIADKEPKPLT